LRGAERIEAEGDERRNEEREQRRKHLGQSAGEVPKREALGAPQIIDAVLGRDRRAGGEQRAPEQGDSEDRDLLLHGSVPGLARPPIAAS
jgi:hypothetical protein